MVSKRRFDQVQPMKLGRSSPFHRLVINTDRPQANGILLQMSSTYITYVHFDTWETYLVIGRTPNELTSEISAFSSDSCNHPRPFVDRFRN